VKKVKEYINEIISILDQNIDLSNRNKAFLFRLENFVHPQIYLEVCRYFKIEASKNGINFNAKLSKEQYLFFKEFKEFKDWLIELENEGFIEQEVQMTAWRNSIADQKGIIFLMGTESIQDKGGLADFYKISPDLIERQLGNKYANWFVKLIDIEDLFEKTVINHFFESLFKVVPKDLFKLSCIVDRLENEKLQGVVEVLESIGRNLVTDWELPSIHSFDNKTINILGKGKKFDLIEKANKFKNRAEFKDGLTKSRFNKLKKKIDQFKNSEIDGPLIESIEHAKKLFGSFNGFESALIDYFKGKNLDELRPKLFELDFNLINTILNFKTKEVDPNQPKENIIKVYGSPIEAFSKIIFNSISSLNSDIIDVNKPKLEINVVEAIISNYIEDNAYDLYNAWTRICFATGGLIDYLQEELDDQIEICFKDHKDPFEISNSDELVIKPSKGTQRLSNILISVNVEGVEKPLEFKWVFNPNEYWLNSFDIHLIEELLETSENTLRFLPIFYCDSLGNLLSSVDPDIFFHQLNSSNQGFINVFDLMPKEIEEGQIASKLFQLIKPFNAFLHDLKNKGFYHTINARKSNSASQFISKYIEVISSILNKDSLISTIEKRYYNLITNLFLILQSKESANEVRLNGAIVPPMHPAMLEKMIEQQAYYRKGLNTLISDTAEITTNIQYEKAIENIIRQSTIISGLDTIISDNTNSRLTKEVFGYYALHGEILNENSLENMVLLDNELVFDEDFNTKDMLSNSFMSRFIEGKLTEYVQTFPAQTDSIKIGFINFEQLQPVVAGVHAFIETLKNISHTINIKLQIISPSQLQEGRTYVNFWLDNFFSEDDNVKIETYYRNINLENGSITILEEVLLEHDMIFINNIMATGRIDYRHTGEMNITPSETRFPMLFHPMPVYDTEMSRKVSISQRQFQASFVYSQLTHRIENPDSKEGIYRIEKELYLSNQMNEVLEILHKKTRWLVTLDTALDRKFFNKDKVISFSTGEGPFGELNMTLSASNTIRLDVINRLTKRLKELFPSWSNEKLNACAKYCIDVSKELDGIKILKALNPYDYEIHSFLSYILSVNSMGINKVDPNLILKAYIPMDSYKHWFIDNTNRPDYLLIEIKREAIKPENIEINATVIECKMGKESYVHIEKGLTQISKSINYLSKIFNGTSSFYNRRYWFAQLYRALVFAQNFVPYIENEQTKFNQSLLNILEGNFKINWSGKLLTYWLNNNEVEVRKETINITENITCSHESYGQLYIQKQLLPEEFSDSVTYEEIEGNLLGFANNRDDFESLVQEFEDELRVDIEETYSVQLQSNPRKVLFESTEKFEQNKTNLPNFVGGIDKNKQITSNESGQENSPKQCEKSSDERLVKEKDDAEILKENTIPLEKVRILLGTDLRTQQKIYWEYGHPQLENRHILISGNSGVGKTYFIQCLLFELAKNGISSIIFDYTDGFKKSKLEPEFKEALNDKIEQFLVFRDKFPVNPFKKNLKELDEDEFVPESDEDIAERIKSVFMAVFKDFGTQQANALYQATKAGIRKYGDSMNLKYLGKELDALGTSHAQTTLTKLQSIIDRNPFDTNISYNWDEHLKQKGKVFIIQLTGFSRDVQLIITEFILWDLWNYLLVHGDKSRPFPAIIDEAQNLDHSEKSPSAKILTEGRKFGWSGWYATQFLQGLKKDEIQRLQMASQKIYFAPPEDAINSIANYLDTDSYKRKEWAKKLSNLRKGQCIVWGPILKPDGNLERTGPRIVNVTPFSERINKL
jgi:Helicase HerA, central domain